MATAFNWATTTPTTLPDMSTSAPPLLPAAADAPASSNPHQILEIGNGAKEIIRDDSGPAHLLGFALVRLGLAFCFTLGFAFTPCWGGFFSYHCNRVFKALLCVG